MRGETGPSLPEALCVVVVLGALGVVVPLLVAAGGGAFGIPRSDDWSYLLTLFRFSETGRVQFNNWVSMTLVGQVALAAPVAVVLGRSIRAVQTLTALLGLGGLLAVVALGRRLLWPRWWAVFVAVTIAAGPLWAPLAASYMTDVPAFAFGVLALVLGVEALRRPPVSPAWLAAALAASFVGFSIRQYAIVPGIAVAAVSAWTCLAADDRPRLRRVVWLFAGFAIAALAVFAWWTGYSNAKSLTPTLPTPHTLWTALLKTTELFRLVGLLLAPVVVLAGPVAIGRRAWRASPRLTLVVPGLVAVTQVVVVARVRATPFLGNYVARDGVLARAVLDGNRPDVVPSALFDLLVAVGIVATVVLAAALVPWLVDLPSRVRRREAAPVDPSVALLGLSLTGYLLAYALAGVTGLPLYDRYALPVLPLVAFLVLRAARADATVPAADRSRAVGGARGRVWVAGLALGALGIVGLAFAVDAAAFDGARWRVATAATHAGFTGREVNGGFEWVNWHRGKWRRLRDDDGKRIGGATGPLYCVVVEVNPSRGHRREVVARETSELPWRDPAAFVALRTSRPCTPSG